MSDTPSPPFSATVALLTAARASEAALTTELAPLGLTVRKYGLLGHIRSQPGVSFSELARRSRITVQSAHVAVQSLVDAGLVTDATAHAGASSSLTVTAVGVETLAAVATALETLDAEFTAADPELAAALEVAMRRRLR
jgi:DNA-binding MarR family transcriptional regulator